MKNRTRHNLSSKKHSIRTLHSLHHWFKHVFTDLGWMVLAKSKGYHDKINCYKNSIKRLHESIEYKIRTVHEIDHKNDLKIMLEDIECLMQHVEKDF